MDSKIILNKCQPSIRPVSFVTNKLLLELSEDFIIDFKHKGLVYRLKVFKGFIFDGSSIPRIAWSLLGKSQVGYSLIGSLIHDLMYMEKDGILESSCNYDFGLITFSKHVPIIKFTDATIQFTRKQADKIMFEVLETNEGTRKNISKIQKGLMYRSIRIFGNKMWKKTTPKNIQNPLKCRGM